MQQDNAVRLRRMKQIEVRLFHKQQALNLLNLASLYLWFVLLNMLTVLYYSLVINISAVLKYLCKTD
jgi:hypothetical protein